MSQISFEQVKSNFETPSQFYFSIEGNIGCGKSTFLSLLKEIIPEVKWIEEPVSEWQNLGGKNINILERYYQEPNRWGFTFQICAIFSRIKALNEACERYPHKIKITQRSILADKHVFSRLMKDLGYMNECQFEIFESLYGNFQSMTKINNLKIIYLRCSPEKCYERTKIRKRPEEEQIPLKYLELIHQKHEKWFESHHKNNVLIIDTTEDFKDNEERKAQMFSKVKDFISNE